MLTKTKNRIVVLLVVIGLISAFIGGVGTTPTHRDAGPTTTPSGPTH